jgi:hypothetical protein
MPTRTILAGAKRHHLEPCAYLRDVLLRLSAGETELESSLTDRWAARRPKHVLQRRLDESRRRAARQKATRERRRARKTAEGSSGEGHRLDDEPIGAAGCRRRGWRSGRRGPGGPAPPSGRTVRSGPVSADIPQMNGDSKRDRSCRPERGSSSASVRLGEMGLAMIVRRPSPDLVKPLATAYRRSSSSRAGPH